MGTSEETALRSPRPAFRPSARALVPVRGAPAADDEQQALPRRATCQTQEHAPIAPLSCSITPPV